MRKHALFFTQMLIEAALLLPATLTVFAAEAGWSDIDGVKVYLDSQGNRVTNTFLNGYRIDAAGTAQLVEFLPVDFGESTNGSHPTDDKLDGEIDTVLKQITSLNMTELEQLHAVYSYVIDHIRYSGGTYVDLETNSFDSMLWEMARYALYYQEGSCYHYAALTQYMLERLGVQSVVLHAESSAVDGGFTNHYWNYVAYEGEWYHFDPMMQDKESFRNCFMATDAEIRNVWYRWEDGAFPPSAGERPTRGN